MEVESRKKLRKGMRKRPSFDALSRAEKNVSSCRAVQVSAYEIGWRPVPAKNAAVLGC